MSREQDREMLEKAAKAAGYTIRAGNQVVEISGNRFFIGRTEGKGWHPLESDADAFRLMVDCEIDVYYVGAAVEACVWTDGAESRFLQVTEQAGTDKHAATRRAIVRASAAMSEGQEG